MSAGHYADLTLATTAHNNESMSHEMLLSFEKYAGTCAQIIIVDDGCVEPYKPPALRSPVSVIRNETATGFCHASDKALRAVSTDHALLVDADVLFLPGDFDGGYRSFSTDQHWCWVNFRQIDFNEGPQQSHETELVPAWVFALGNQARSWWTRYHPDELCPAPGQRIAPVEIAHSSCAFVRMAAFRAIGGFDLWYWQTESDVDLSLKFIKAGYGAGIDTRYTVKHEGSGGKTGGDKRTTDLYRARLHLYEKFDPAARVYLRPLLFARHLCEVLYFSLSSLADKKQAERIPLRLSLLKSVMKGY